MHKYCFFLCTCTHCLGLSELYTPTTLAEWDIEDGHTKTDDSELTMGSQLHGMCHHHDT